MYAVNFKDLFGLEIFLVWLVVFKILLLMCKKCISIRKGGKCNIMKTRIRIYVI